MRRWICAVFALAACRTGQTLAPSAPAPAPQSTQTRWVKARSAAETPLFEAPARVLGEPDSAAAVSPPSQARVVRVRVRPGQRVAEKEPLFDVLMPEILHAAGDLAAGEIKIEAYSKRKKQLEGLRQEGLARIADLAEVEAQLSTARADAQAARATLRSAGLTDARAAELLAGDGLLALRAPIGGLVTAVDAVAGEVREPAGKPLAQIVGEGGGRVEARLQAALVEGARFVFVGPSGVVALQLISISPRVEPTDGARLAWFSAIAGQLQIGETGRVRMIGDPAWQVVPARAVVGEAPRTTVLVRRGDEGVPTPARLVAKSGADAVVDGLEVDAEVAADAAPSRAP